MHFYSLNFVRAFRITQPTGWTPETNGYKSKAVFSRTFAIPFLSPAGGSSRLQRSVVVQTLGNKEIITLYSAELTCNFPAVSSYKCRRLLPKTLRLCLVAV